VRKEYIPEKGDMVWLNFTPQSGHEQAGKRPAIILSPAEYNRKTGLVIVCQITSKVKGYPFEVEITGEKITGVILSDQVKSLDWRARHAAYIETVQDETLTEIQEKLFTLLG